MYLSKSGKVTDITEYLDNDPDWKAMFSDQDLEFNSYEGKIYGIPVSKEISYIYYNKDLFKKAGLEAPDVAYETWDDFYKACDTLKAKGITPVSMDTADLGWLSNLWYSGLIGTAGEEGNKFMNTMYPTDYTSDLVVNATEQLQKMLKNYTTSQFDIIYMTTKGGPGNATLNLPTYLYKIITLENNYGKANAVGVIQIALGLVLVILIQKLFNQKQEMKEV